MGNGRWDSVILKPLKLRVQASLTGHLVLSTLHTIIQQLAVTLLKDMGLNHLAKVLDRCYCTTFSSNSGLHCDLSKSRWFWATSVPTSQRWIYAVTWNRIGNPKCSHVGFSGRTAIMRNCASRWSDARWFMVMLEFELENHAPPCCFDSWWWFIESVSWKTTLEEVLRVTNGCGKCKYDIEKQHGTMLFFFVKSEIIIQWLRY